MSMMSAGYMFNHWNSKIVKWEENNENSKDIKYREIHTSEMAMSGSVHFLSILDEL